MTAPDLEAAQRTAERKAAALSSLGWERGTGAAVWARGVADMLALHESARSAHATNTANLEAWERLHSTALMLAIAIDQVLVYTRRVVRLTGDAHLAHNLDRFSRDWPDTGDLRDLVAHLDEYAIGDGQRQTGARTPRLDDTNVESFIYWVDGGGTLLNLGDRSLDLRRAAADAVQIAPLVEGTRQRYLERANTEANDALRRKWRALGVLADE